MCQNDLIPFQHIYEESKNIYKLLFTLNGAAIVSLVTLIVSYDKNDVLKGFEILSGNLFWFVLTILFLYVLYYVYIHVNFIYGFVVIEFIVLSLLNTIIMILFLNFIYGISYLYSVLKYGITIL